MISGSEKYLSILVSSSSLLASVAMILTAILLLKKGKIFNQFARRFMIGLLIVAFGISVYLVYLVFAFGNSHTSQRLCRYSEPYYKPLLSLDLKK